MKRNQSLSESLEEPCFNLTIKPVADFKIAMINHLLIFNVKRNIPKFENINVPLYILFKVNFSPGVKLESIKQPAELNKNVIKCFKQGGIQQFFNSFFGYMCFQGVMNKMVTF